jgi:uncharacterized protein YggU (UPF0235/DUF167 family)
VTFWRVKADGVTVMVKVTPRSRRPGVHGARASATGERLRIDVTEVAEKGEANRAACDLLADLLRQPRGNVRVIAGAANREKLLAVTGDVVSLTERLRSL